MLTDRCQTYLESEVLQADGVKLVQMLYRCALDSLRQARKHLQEGDITARSGQISKTAEILNELALTVDHEVGSELSRNLVELYDYLQTLLQQANSQQADAPLAEAQKLLGILLEGWEGCGPEPSVTPAGVFVPSPDASAEYVPVDCIG